MAGVGFESKSSAHTPEIHARKSATVPALCAAPPGKPFTTTRAYVTCPGCRAEIERRLADGMRRPKK